MSQPNAELELSLDAVASALRSQPKLACDLALILDGDEDAVRALRAVLLGGAGRPRGVRHA